MTALNLDGAARVLVSLGVQWAEAYPPRIKAVASERLNGACDALHAVGLGMTPFAVRMAAQDALSAAGPRPAQTAHGTERKAWTEAVTRSLAEALDDL